MSLKIWYDSRKSCSPPLWTTLMQGWRHDSKQKKNHMLTNASRLHLCRVEGRPTRTMVRQLYGGDTVFTSPANRVTLKITWCQVRLWMSDVEIKQWNLGQSVWIHFLVWTFTITFWEIINKMLRNQILTTLYDFYLLCFVFIFPSTLLHTF